MGLNRHCSQRAAKRFKSALENLMEAQPIQLLDENSMAEYALEDSRVFTSLNGNESSSNWILENERIGSRGQVKKSEFVRLMTQAMYSLGYKNSAALLEEESKFQFQPKAVTTFRDGILEGKWDDCLSKLDEMPLDVHQNKGASFLILEQKFLELLEAGFANKALHVLRMQIAPLCLNYERVHKLSSLVICLNEEELKSKAQWSGSKGDSRQQLLIELQNLFPPSIMIPENRLLRLVENSLDAQRKNCVFHNSFNTNFSLYVDHHCGKDQIPSVTTQVLDAHKDEVWSLQFSHDGTRLASASKDKSIIIWEVGNGTNASVQRTLIGHTDALSFLAWSPNDAYLLSCANDCLLKLWDTHSGACVKTYERHTEAVTTCAWLPDGSRFLSGSMDKRVFLWDLEGNVLKTWTTSDLPKISVNDVAISRDGQFMVSVVNEKYLRMLHLASGSVHVIAESAVITSMALSSCGHSCLLTLTTGSIHLWDNLHEKFQALQEQQKLARDGGPRKSVGAMALPTPDKIFNGMVRGRFVIRSCFGGSEDSFVVSGSEDSQVYIWHRGTGDLLQKLQGHSGTVNAVSWNPKNPHMFASASDDKTIRIWGVPGPVSKHS